MTHSPGCYPGRQDKSFQGKPIPIPNTATASQQECLVVPCGAMQSGLLIDHCKVAAGFEMINAFDWLPEHCKHVAPCLNMPNMTRNTVSNITSCRYHLKESESHSAEMIMTMAGKGLMATSLGLLASMGGSFVCVAPLQARGALVKSGWLSSGSVVAAKSPRREVRLCPFERRSTTMRSFSHVGQHLSRRFEALAQSEDIRVGCRRIKLCVPDVLHS